MLPGTWCKEAGQELVSFTSLHDVVLKTAADANMCRDTIGAAPGLTLVRMSTQAGQQTCIKASAVPTQLAAEPAVRCLCKTSVDNSHTQLQGCRPAAACLIAADVIKLMGGLYM